MTFVPLCALPLNFYPEIVILTMEFSSPGFSLLVFQKVIYGEQEALSVCENMRERKSRYMCGFLTRILCVCRSSMTSSVSGVWRRLGTACGVVPETLLSRLWSHLQ
jgi:hypothetical protein